MNEDDGIPLTRCEALGVAAILFAVFTAWIAIVSYAVCKLLH